MRVYKVLWINEILSRLKSPEILVFVYIFATRFVGCGSAVCVRISTINIDPPLWQRMLSRSTQINGTLRQQTCGSTDGC